MLRRQLPEAQDTNGKTTRYDGVRRLLLPPRSPVCRCRFPSLSVAALQPAQGMGLNVHFALRLVCYLSSRRSFLGSLAQKTYAERKREYLPKAGDRARPGS